MKKIMVLVLTTFAFAYMPTGCSASGNNSVSTTPPPVQSTEYKYPVATAEPTTEPHAATAEPAPSYKPLNLPIIAVEQTIVYDKWAGTIRITPNGILQRLQSDDWQDIDTDVRSIYAKKKENKFETVFYIKNDNSLWGYGSNLRGILGDGTGVDKENPIHILDNVAMIGLGVISGESLVYAITTDKVLMEWGGGNNFSPIPIREGVVNFFDFSTHDFVYHTSEGQIIRRDYIGGREEALSPEYAIAAVPRYDGLECYVSPTGALMYPDFEEVRNRYSGVLNYNIVGYSEVASDVDKIFYVYNGILFTKSDGSLWGIGQNTGGELGDGTKVPREKPVKIADGVVAVYQYGFLKSDGTYWVWDSNNPVPRQSLENIAEVLDPHKNGNLLYFLKDGTVQYGDNFFDNVKIPQTVIFQ